MNCVCVRVRDICGFFSASPNKNLIADEISFFFFVVLKTVAICIFYSFFICQNEIFSHSYNITIRSIGYYKVYSKIPYHQFNFFSLSINHKKNPLNCNMSSYHRDGSEWVMHIEWGSSQWNNKMEPNKLEVKVFDWSFRKHNEVLFELSWVQMSWIVHKKFKHMTISTQGRKTSEHTWEKNNQASTHTHTYTYTYT